MKNKKLIQIGGGKMGSIWLKSFNKYNSNVLGIVDPNKQVNSLADKYDTKRVSNINKIEEKADIWCIATPIKYHHKYISKAIQQDINSVLVEKPATLHPKINHKLIKSADNTDINVDYIELENFAFKTVLKDIEKSNFNLSEAIHWRGKSNAERLFPYMRNELVHDISEIIGLYYQQGQDVTKINIEDVSNVKLWQDETDKYRTDNRTRAYDIQGSIHLKGANNESILMKGGFNQEHERRYFLWINGSKDCCYLVNTLSREDIEPFSARITGRESVKLAREKCVNGKLISDADFKELIRKTNASVLTDMNNKLPSYSIAKKIINDKTAPINLSKAAVIEQIMYDVYKYSNTPELYKPIDDSW